MLHVPDSGVNAMLRPLARRSIVVFAAPLLAPLPAAAAQTDRIVVGMVLEPPHLDPTQSPAAPIKEILYASVMEGLTRIDQSGAILPDLAESWRSPPMVLLTPSNSVRRQAP
jgi:ABC-type transport system substrate-binding protein